MKRPNSFITGAGGIVVMAVIAFSVAACSGSHNGGEKAVPQAKVQNAISQFKQGVPRTVPLFKNAYGYAVFPGVGKGALVIGGAYGGGYVYKHGQLVGHTTITKFNIGAQIGGKTFSEVIFFQNARSFNHFTGGNFQFSANATAAGGTVGATANNAYSNGVAVFTMTGGGLMAGANIGGQKFSYTPTGATATPTRNNSNSAGSGNGYNNNAGTTTGAGAAIGTMNNGNGYGNANANANTAQHRPLEPSDVEKTIATFKAKRSGIGQLFNDAYGYAVFPTVGKGGLIIGGAYGGGSVFQHGKLVGHSTITNFSIGAQIGGKTFSEVIFFQNAKAFNHFTSGHFQFGSNTVSVGSPAGVTTESAATATTATTATTAQNAYNDSGFAVFTQTKSGFLVGINIGGQKFSYTPESQLKNKH